MICYFSSSFGIGKRWPMVSLWTDVPPWLFLAIVVPFLGNCAGKPLVSPPDVPTAYVPSLSDAADLKPVRQHIQPSQTGVYLVQPGDTLWGIAMAHGLGVAELVARNRIDNPRRLRVGQELHIWASGPTTSQSPLVSKGPSIGDGIVPMTAGGMVKEEVLEERGGVKQTSVVRETQRGVVATKVAKASRVVDRRPRTNEGGKVSPIQDMVVTLPPVSSPTGSAVAVPVSAVLRANDFVDPAVNAQNAPSLSPIAPTQWLWPLEGPLLGSFLEKGRRHNTGIDIAAQVGTPVHATADGIVVYADDALASYGKLVLLRHGGSFMSAYAHNNEILVKRGDLIRAGDVIAHSGDSGRVDSPRLHFELRRRVTPLDPLHYLPKLAAQ